MNKSNIWEYVDPEDLGPLETAHWEVHIGAESLGLAKKRAHPGTRLFGLHGNGNRFELPCRYAHGAG